MIELSPYYFSSIEKDHSLVLSYYPINQQWKLVITQKKKSVEYWLNKDQAINIRDLLAESLTEISDQS